jgi:hypothetical protein
MKTRKVTYLEQAKRLRYMNNKTRAFFYGFYAAFFTILLALATFIIALFTPPISGPFCSKSCIQYPFTDCISRFPGDYIWMYFAIILMLAYLILIICIHAYAPGKKRIFSQLGLTFAILSTAVLVSDYFIQISVIQPSLLNGEANGISILTQYNPHGIFIALEEIGFLFMSISFISILPVFRTTKKLERAIRRVLIASFILSCISFILIYILYGIHREYRFEVIIISINWITLIIAGVLLCMLFKRKIKKKLKVL